jgi:hypothetical protein
LIDSIQSIFSLEHLEYLARSSKFVQRTSKLTAAKFLDLLFKDASTESGMSLRTYSNELETAHGVWASAQAVNNRFNDYAVKFVRKLVSIVFSAQISRSFDDSFLTRYSSVCIWDATRIELPAHLSEDFPGFGGSASRAGISIQYRYDLKNRTGSSLDVYPATYSDADYTKKFHVEENSLEIFDLGYVNADFLMRLQAGNSYYVCRLHTRASVYHTDGTPLDFEETYRWMQKHKITVYQKDVLVGEKRLPVRMVLSPVDEPTYQKRIRKMTKEYKEKGLNVRDQYKIRMRFNIMITNTDQADVPAEKVYLLYRLRWQIELIFKSWKSAGWNLDKIKEVKYERYMCILYAKLLMIILSDRIYSFFAKEHYRRDQKILSSGKCVKTIREQIGLICKFIHATAEIIHQILDTIGILFSRGHVLCKRKNRVGYQDLFELFICQTK